ncbi:MAG TPA: glycoside hydrolase family 3 C-terminal domain-containing protein [Clostridia bacterium]|nr:glycoside hydrolase family 3 C-terminal domain-containing protein [Clostridia bacterium]
MKSDIKALISKMTLEEKASLCSGLDSWHTKPVERLGIPSIMMTDGPHGLRKQVQEEDHSASTSEPATCFPTGAALACSWDRSLIGEVGMALGEECQKEQVSIVLGPAANIKRSPLCGRNFEYLSEDPYLSSEMAASHIKGVQGQGVGTSLKHFAANNQETRRFLIDAVIDERTLREIYLASFEGAVRQEPWTIMCAYNKLNGEYCSENKYLLTDILRQEWGHKGIVMSDWGAVNDRPKGLAAGLELEMPTSGGRGDEKIVRAVRSGKLPESVLDNAVQKLLELIFKAVDSQKANASCDMKAHDRLARKVAGECAVLLKNDDCVLPLKKNGKLAIIGAFAKNPRYQGGGSSHVNPHQLDCAYDEILKKADGDIEITYAAGYREDAANGIFSKTPLTSASDIADPILIDEAVDAARKADAAVIFAGLPENYESESYDRKHLRMPEGHNQLIEAVAAVQKNIVVVLSNGAPVEIPWLGEVKAVLEMYLGGQASGGAAADLLFGDINPSGKLAETFPRKLSDNPSWLNFPGDNKKVEYREGIFVGYRYYDTAGAEPLFPFGHGLSYTKFDYVDISADRTEIYDNDELHIKVTVRNSGKLSGKEIIQLYVSDSESSVLRPKKELKGFEKVELAPGEEKTVTFTLGKRAFAFYNTEIRDWFVESGEFVIMAGPSSGTMPLKTTISVNSSNPVRRVFTLNSTPHEIMSVPEGKEEMKKLLKSMGSGDDHPDNEMEVDQGKDTMLKEMPLRSFITFFPNVFKEEPIQQLLDKLNRQ